MTFEVEAAKRHGAQPVPVFTFYVEGGAEYEVPSYHIRNAGSLLWEKSPDFGDLNSSDHALTLINTEGLYTPGHPDFIFAADPNFYYRRRLKIELGYRRPGTAIIDKELLYRGIILEWGPTQFPSPEDQEVPTVEVYTQDLLTMLLEAAILGRPDTLGDPQPLIYGQIMAEADSMADNNPDTPNKTAYFEDGTITGGTDAFDSLTEAGGGDVAIDDANPYDGDYCARARVTGANQTAYGHKDLAAPADVIQCQFALRLDEIPLTPTAGNCEFLEILDSGGVRRAYLEVRAAYQVRINIYKGGVWTFRDIDWWLNSYEDTYCVVSVVISKTDKYIKVFVDNSEVFNWEPTAAPFGDYQTLKVGFKTGGTAETWSAYIDNIKIWNSFYRYLYRIPGGGVFISIDGVWVDGAVVNYDSGGLSGRKRRRYNKKHWLTKRYGKAKPLNAELVTYYPAFGGVGFAIDVSNVFVLATKNTTTHPVDVLTALFTAAGLSSYIDPASFAAVKAATPGDVTGCIIEDMTALDAVMEVCGKCLYDFNPQIPATLRAYNGGPPASVRSLTDADLASIESRDLPREIVNLLTLKYGWYEHDNRSRIIVREETSITNVGERPEDLSLEWGEPVATPSRTMAQAKADLYITRMGAAPRGTEVYGRLDLATLRLDGGVTLTSASLGRPAEVCEIMAVEVDLQEWTTRLSLMAFLGEGL